MAKVYFYYAAMNAGKTTVLLQSSYNYRERGMHTLLFTPSIDTRYGTGRIESRIGLRSGALVLAPGDNLLAYVRAEHAVRPVACVLIDEAQFLTAEQVWQATDVADTLDVPVLCYGLRTDFQGKLFPGSAALLGVADDLIELKTVCHCGRKATMNLRTDPHGHATNDGAQIEIGGNNRYVAMCRKHYKEALAAAGVTLTRSPFPRVAAAVTQPLAVSTVPTMPSSHLIYLGTYTRTTSKGIYAVRLDNDSGALSEPVLVAEAANPTWLVLSPDKKFLYSTHASETQAAAFAIDPTTTKLTHLPAPAANPANSSSHLAIDTTGRSLLSANYADGYVSSLPIHPDGTLAPPTHIPHTGHSVDPKRQDKPHAHSVTVSPDNRFVIVCDLGLDKVFSYALDAASAKLTPAASPFATTEPGAGPRHFKFSADGRHGYAINEMGGTITVFDYDPTHGALTPIQTIPTLPPDFAGEKWNAEIRVHPNGRFVYGSNRTHDSLAVFAVAPATGLLTLVEIVPSGGKTPRNFALSPDGRWLVCAHQDSDNLTVFRVDPAAGRLSLTPHTAKVPMCVCVLFYD